MALFSVGDLFDCQLCVKRMLPETAPLCKSLSAWKVVVAGWSEDILLARTSVLWVSEDKTVLRSLSCRGQVSLRYSQVVCARFLHHHSSIVVLTDLFYAALSAYVLCLLFLSCCTTLPTFHVLAPLGWLQIKIVGVSLFRWQAVKHVG